MTLTASTPTSQLDAVIAMMKGAQAKLITVSGGLDDLFSVLPTTIEGTDQVLIDDSSGAPALAEILATSERGLVDAFGGVGLGGEIDDFVTQVQQTITNWNATLNAWASADTIAQATLGTYFQTIQASEIQASTSLEQLDLDIQSAMSALKADLASLHQAARGLQGTLTGEHQAIAGASSSFQTSLDVTLTQQVETTDAQTVSHVQRLFANLDQLVTDLTGETDTTLSDALSNLGNHVSQNASRKVDQAFVKLIDTLLKELLAKATKAVATSVIGVQITATISPVLPELIAIRRITDAILSAIEAWNDIKSGGGLWG
jgi:hypothetical protein